MNYAFLRILTVLVMMLCSLPAKALTTNFTASFAPSLDKPESNTFTNTTPQSGYCAVHPSQCKNNTIFSVSIGLIGTLSTAGIYKNAAARDSMYFGMPGAWREFTVTNTETGSKASVSFRVSAFSAAYNYPSGKGFGSWSGGSFVNAPSPCSYSGVGIVGGTFYQFMWKLPTSAKDVACYKIATADYLGAPTSIGSLSLGYELKTPNPLKMESGTYTGTLKLSAGPGEDIDFGDNFTVNDSNIYLKFTLSVNHELKLTTTADNQTVSLQPCASGRICTEDEGSANWERWMVTRITPELTGRSNFRLSSSGAFTVYLECEQQIGSDCALKSDNTPSQTVPVQTLLTLPDNIVDNSTGSTVSKRRLAVGQDLTRNIFVTKMFSQNKAGSIDFLVSQKDVDTMLKTRPDTYRGAVTVIFDPKIY